MTLTREYLEGAPEVRHLPGEYRLLGALAGIPVAESKALRYDEMYFGQGTMGLVVGETRHFLYRMKQIDLNVKAREAAAAHIKNSARRILGEEWNLSPK